MVELRTLGTVDLRHPDGSPAASVLAQPKRLALLVYLAVEGGGAFHRRDTLLGMFWPDSDMASARRALTQSVYVLRRALGAGVIVSRGDDELCVPPGSLRCDAADFQTALADGRPEDALDLYGGEILPGFYLSDPCGWEQWLDAERTRLCRLATEAADQLAAAAETRGDAAGALTWARRATSFSPDNERNVRRLLTLLATTGDRATALREYEQFARRLQAEYEAEPSAETRALAATLRAEVAAPPEPEVPAPRVEAVVAAVPAVAATVAVAVPPPEPLPERPVYPVEVSTPGPWNLAAAPPRRPRSRGWGRTTRAALATAVAVLLGYSGFRWAARQPNVTEAREAAAPTVVVLPFTVHGERSLAPAAESMVTLLATRLHGAGSIRAVAPHTLIDFVREQDGDLSTARLGRAAAERFGAGWYVLGGVIGADQGVRLQASLYSSDGNLRASAETHTADRGQLFTLADELARELLAGWAPLPNQHLSRSAAANTQSFVAVRAFLRGEEAYQAERYADAVTSFRAATAADSAFALAHYRLSMAIERWHGTTTAEARAAAVQAADLAARLPEQGRLLVAARVALVTGNVGRADSLYRAVVAAYPEEGESWFELGKLVARFPAATGRPAAEAREPLRRALALQPGHVGALVQLARLEAGQRDSGARARLTDLVRQAEQAAPDDARTLEMQVLQTFAHGTDVERRSLLEDRLRGEDDAGLWDLAWTVAAHAQRPSRADAILALLLERQRPARTQAMAHLARAHMAQAAGRPALAEKRLRSAAEINPSLAAITRASFTLLPHLAPSRSDLARARSGLAVERNAPASFALETPDGSAREGEGPWSAFRWARTRLRQGDPAGALRALAAAPDEDTPRRIFSSFSAVGHQRFLRAESLRATGRPHEAVDEYTGLIDNMGYDVAYLPLAQLRRAELYEQLGDDAAAVEGYRRLLELWMDAEPRLRPEVVRVEQRLRQLALP